MVELIERGHVPPQHDNTNAEVIARIQHAYQSTLESVCPPAENYAVVDFPNYSNVGDSAIYLGQAKSLSAIYKRQPAFLCEMAKRDIPELKRHVPSGPIFINGGGNFGDLWPRHQVFREALMEAYPDRHIIQLPQSIHFESPAALESAARTINRFKNFTLLVRDRKSLQIAQQHFTCDIRLCPDGAFMLGALTPPTAPSKDIFLLLRTDKEVTARGEFPAPEGLSFDSADWVEEGDVASGVERFEKLARKFSVARPLLNERRVASYHRWAQLRLERGLRLLSSGRFVITDRLHAHILTVLLGKPHAVLDNSYGKISSFIACWTEGGDFTSVTTLEEAAGVANRFFAERSLGSQNG